MTKPATVPLFERMPTVFVDRAALQANWRMLASRNRSGRTGAAVKADGYGLGAQKVALALFEAGCRDFFVAWPDEAIALRIALRRVMGQADEPRIFVLQGLEPQAVPVAVDYRLTPVLSNPDDLACWREGLERLGAQAPAALQFETGMNRLGLEQIAAPALGEEVAAGRLAVSLVLSHLASADDNREQTERQRAVFDAIAACFPDTPKSLANSAGALIGEDYHYDLTRPGIALYGGRAGSQSDGLLSPVATLTAAILQLRIVRAGEPVGYGGATVLGRDSVVATVGLGYADGLLRALSGSGVPMREVVKAPKAFVAGRAVPVLGRVSMDLTLLDVTDCPQEALGPGERAEFFGPNMPIDAVATSAGTIAYELLTSLGPRVYRKWSA